MPHFLQYWKTYNPAREVGTPLDFAASAQFKRVKPGDTLWIVALRRRRLTLLGRLIVGTVVSRSEAIKALGQRVYDAPLVALAKPGTEQEIVEADIQPLAPELRFNSAKDRLSLPDPKRTDGKQLQSMRELQLESGHALQVVLEGSGAQKQYSRRVLFARIGWMTYYAGPQTGDEKPIGGGRNNKRNIGHELFNFMDFGGRLYGFVRAADRRIKLARIDPTHKGDTLRDVLVVFVARQRVVGWYQGATIHQTEATFPSDVSKEIRGRLKRVKAKNFTLERYSFECPIENAVLLPKFERTHEIPGAVKGGFGQSNVCYAYENNGKRKFAPWIDDTVSYVLSYRKENLLTNKIADNESEEAATMSQEQAAGFQSNPAIRRAVEKYAMSKAHAALAAMGYTNLTDTSKLRPYDFTCERHGKTFYAEVKGTQTTGTALILTRGEVEHINSHPDDCILVLVHSVSVSVKETVSGGKIRVTQSWKLHPDDLRPVQYIWKLGGRH
jgi:hypothetical protein